MKKLIPLILIVLIGFGFSLCHKPEKMKTTNENQVSKDINDLDVNDNFKWKTIKNVHLTIKSSNDNIILLKTLKGDIIQKAKLKGGISFNTKITIPTYVEEITAICGNESKQISIQNAKVEINFN